MNVQDIHTPPSRCSCLASAAAAGKRKKSKTIYKTSGVIGKEILYFTTLNFYLLEML